jgi:SAM-dependent methyltransferase
MEESSPRNLPDRYLIKAGYRQRERPDYDDQSEISANWQIGVYEQVVLLAERLNARHIVDVGCGDARKLAPLHSRFSIVGIDYGVSLELCRNRYPYGTWIEYDLTSEGSLPLDERVLRSSVIVCADVIEHLVHPEALLAKLREALRMAPVVLLSTPDRDLVNGRTDMGPPRNTGHVREWTLNEFSFFLASQGFHDGTIELVRSNDRSPEKRTVMATLFGNTEGLNA